jgi:hypothetical protein
MTEEEWLHGGELEVMLGYLRGKASLRKRRLFACACCRRVWSLIDDDRDHKAIESCEAMVDLRRITQAQLFAAIPLGRFRTTLTGSMLCGDASATANHAQALVWGPGYQERYNAGSVFAAIAYAKAAGAAEGRAQCRLLREIFGNPFRSAADDTAWRTTTVVQLAKVIYQDRQFEELSVLADALEEAGCADGDLVAHCREPGGHVRGCWALDWILGKK